MRFYIISIFTYLRLGLYCVLATDHIGAGGPWLKYRGHLANISRLSIPFFAAAIPIIETTNMAATLPSRLAKRFSSNPQIRSVPISIGLPEIRYIQVWHPRNDEEPAHVWLRKLIKNVSAEE